MLALLLIVVYRYLIKKDFLQSIQRMIRNENRAKIKEDEHNTSAKSAKKSPFIQAMKELQDTSDEDTSDEEKITDDVHVTDNFTTPKIHNTDTDENKTIFRLTRTSHNMLQILKETWSYRYLCH